MEHSLKRSASMDTSNMQLKADAPSLLRPVSPKKLTVTLPGIPEASPGPNAFAQQAMRMERHRLEGNAFYQEEVQRRRVTPPTIPHPALRGQSLSSLSEAGYLHVEDAQRDSTTTTMSPFIDAGGPKKTPSLKLVPLPVPGHTPEPTQRGFIEEKRESEKNDAMSGNGDRIPVYTYSAKVSSGEAVKPHTTPKKTRVSLGALDSLKSPKKSLLDKLRMPTLRSSPSQATGTPDRTQEVQSVPVKAQAVLGTSPSKGNLSRSTSKQKKGLFTRKNAELTDVDTSRSSWKRKSLGPNDLGHSSRIVAQDRTPQTGHSDPTHYTSPPSKRFPSQTFPEHGRINMDDHNGTACAVQRSQSLKYFDSMPPPTPPAKNTPPQHRAKLDALTNNSNRVSFNSSSILPPKSPAGIMSTSSRLSPTKFGSYGHKEMPTLVTKPSLYSLHASVVPEMIEPGKFEEMKAHIDGLGLGGFDMPSEYNQGSPELVYSPSIYADDWSTRPNTVAWTPKFGQHSTSEDLSTVPEGANGSPTKSRRTKRSTSSDGTIPIFYAEARSSPSLHSMTRHLEPPSFTVPGTLQHHFAATLGTPELLLSHGRTHSRDHSVSGSPRHSVASNIFALPIADAQRDAARASTGSYCPSAAPSPLHFLPAMTYVRPTREARLNKFRADTETRRLSEAQENAGGRSQAESLTGSPVHKGGNIVDSAPMLLARQRPQTDPVSMPGADNIISTNTETRNSAPAAPASDKQDQMLTMLSNLMQRNGDVTSIRDEMLAETARMSDRLAAVENSQRVSPAPSVSSDGRESGPQRGSQVRIPTDVAHEFYRYRPTPPNSTQDGMSDRSATELETMAELRERNRRLEGIVMGFAQELDEIKRKVAGAEG